MRMIGLPEIVNPGGATRMSPESMVDGTSKSLATECARLCSDEGRIFSMKLTGLPKKPTRSGLQSMYNIRADPDLGYRIRLRLTSHSISLALRVTGGLSSRD